MSDTATKTQKGDHAFAWQLSLAFVLGAAALMLPDLANAATTQVDTPIGAIFCKAAGWFTGNTGKGIATIAVTIIGIGALLGKVSWGMALIVGLGIALTFGAAGIIDVLNPDGTVACSTDTSTFTTR